MTAPADRKSTPQIALSGFQTLPENQVAVRAVKLLARAVLLGKRVSVCPLLLHGPTGSGKSQLAAAFVKAVTASERGITARTESAGDLARLAATGEDAGFADRDLQACDVLILEDVQHLHERASDAVCALLDGRVRRRRATIITTRTSPADLTQLPRRLTSRLAAGLVVNLDPLGPASRRTLLKSAARTRNVRLTPDALDWLAEQSGSVRAAFGSLQNLAQIAPQYPGPLDRDAAELVLAGTGQPTSRELAPDAIIERVAAAFGVTEKELLGPSRLRSVLRARQVAMYLARELAALSLPRIGAAFGRDHTTVLHAIRKIDAELETDAELGARVRQLRNEFV